MLYRALILPKGASTFRELAGFFQNMKNAQNMGGQQKLQAMKIGRSVCFPR